MEDFEVFEVSEVWEVVGVVGVEDFQPLQKVGDFRLPMLVFSPIIKVNGVKKGSKGSICSMGSKG